MELMAGSGGDHGGEQEEIVDIDQQVIPWLPSHVLDEALGLNSFTSPPPPTCTADYRNHKVERELDHRGRHYYQHHHDHHPHKFNAQPFLQNRTKHFQKPRYHNDRGATGGPGMQAIFLDPSGHKSNGTGVFLPRCGGGTDFHRTNKPPTCSPVLLPSRVVQALNLNVQALGLQISPKKAYSNSTNNKKMVIGERVNSSILEEKEVTNHASIVSQDRCSSQEVFLPKEWTY